MKIRRKIFEKLFKNLQCSDRHYLDDFIYRYLYDDEKHYYNIMVQRIERQYVLESREYYNIRTVVTSLLEEEIDTEDKIAILNYGIDLLKNDIKHLNSEKFMDIVAKSRYYNTNFYEERDRMYTPTKIVLPSKFCLENGKEEPVSKIIHEQPVEPYQIDASKVCIISKPRDLGRHFKNVKRIYRNGFNQKTDPPLLYYKQLDLYAVIYDGNHSAAIAQTKNEGTFTVTKEVDIAPLFPHIDASGFYWINTHKKSTSDYSIDYMVDERIGLIYSLAKMKWQIENNIQQ